MAMVDKLINTLVGMLEDHVLPESFGGADLGGLPGFHSVWPKTDVCLSSWDSCGFLGGSSCLTGVGSGR